MKRIPVFVRVRRAVFIGANDHSPRRVLDLLSGGAEVSLFCPRVPRALLPQVVDGFVRHAARLPQPEDLQDVDAVFLQTGDPIFDRAWRLIAEERGVQIIMAEPLRPETSQPGTFCCGPFALTIHPVHPLRALRRQLRLLQRHWRQVRVAGARPVRREAAGHGPDT